MANNYSYHRILPQNAKDFYQEFDVVDFELDFPERALLLGTVRLEGEVEVLVNDATTLNLTTQIPALGNKEANKLDIRLDGRAGAHSFIENITTTVNGQVVESLGDYARYVKMSSVAMTSPDDITCNSSNVCEMKAGKDTITNNILKGELVANDPTLSTGIVRNNPDFSIKPRICLNGGEGSLPSRRANVVQVSFNLARNYGALYGMDMASIVAYKLKDLRLVYVSVPDDGSNNPIPCRTKINVKQSIASSKANVNVRVANSCDAVSCSFQVQSQENSSKYNNLVCHPVPNLTSTQFLFNDQTNSLISYQIRNNAEILDRAIDSFVDAQKNGCSPPKIANGENFLLGLNFDEMIPLGNQKFSVEIDSSITNLVPLVMYMYFHSMVEL
tara:strand:- start:502 stop:1662 length:1161 start_codon:yes stop_codon:yes gene_type:complete